MSIYFMLRYSAHMKPEKKLQKGFISLITVAAVSCWK